jgi:hypothetical protein
VEQEDGTWECRFGTTRLDVMPDEASALSFLTRTATARGGCDHFEIYLHHLDGALEKRPACQPLPGEEADTS